MDNSKTHHFQDKSTIDPESVRIIEACGGPSAISKLFTDNGDEITRSAVCQWKYGIPKNRLLTIKLLRPELFSKAA